jgi:cytochrome P450
MNAAFEIPSHIPPERVIDFDFANVPGATVDPHLAWKKLHDGPDIVWTPHYGGHWIATRHEDIELIQRDHDHFSHREFSLPKGVKPFRFAPLEYDPPEHGPYRAVINPAFTPKAVGDLEGDARKLAIELIEGFKPKGGCEFTADFAHHLPVRMFLLMANLPLEHRDRFIDWATTMVHGANKEEKQQAFGATVAYLSKIIAERSRHPGTDLMSRVITAKIGGKPMEDEIVTGMTAVLFFGGLDTVASMMGFIAIFLARHPAHRKQLIDNPALIPDAVEEFLRRFGLSNTMRTLTMDFEYKGVHFKQDDMIQVPISLAGMDERHYPNAMDVDFSRKPLHLTFGSGPHRCPGSLLARTEIRVFIEEWLKRIPDFEIKAGETPLTVTGPVNGVVNLPLTWNA